MSAQPLMGDAVQRRTIAPVTPETIARIKEALKSVGLPDRIYKWTFNKEEFVYRPLLRKDWLEVNAFVAQNQSNVSQDVFLQKVCEKGLIYPDIAYDPIQWELQAAGVQQSLGKLILAQSGFPDPDLNQDLYLRVEPIGPDTPDAKPDKKLLEALQAEAQWPLKLTLVGKRWYVLRPLSRIEWKILQGQAQEGEDDLPTAERAIVWNSITSSAEKPDLSGELAGTAQALAGVVMTMSGFYVQPTVEEL